MVLRIQDNSPRRKQAHQLVRRQPERLWVLPGGTPAAGFSDNRAGYLFVLNLKSWRRSKGMRSSRVAWL